jgi:hypothetical protein
MTDERARACKALRAIDRRRHVRARVAAAGVTRRQLAAVAAAAGAGVACGGGAELVDGQERIAGGADQFVVKLAGGAVPPPQGLLAVVLYDRAPCLVRLDATLEDGPPGKIDWTRFDLAYGYDGVTLERAVAFDALPMHGAPLHYSESPLELSWIQVLATVRGAPNTTGDELAVRFQLQVMPL